MAADATPTGEIDDEAASAAAALAAAELATFEDLVTPNLTVERYRLPTGKVVEVRPLSRAEVLHVKGREFKPDELERFLLSKAMVNPGMTDEQVKRWHGAAAAGSMEGLTKFITRISGLNVDASKSGDAEVRG